MRGDAPLELGLDLRQPRRAHAVLQRIAHQRPFIDHGLALRAALPRITHGSLRHALRFFRLQLNTAPLLRFLDHALRLMAVFCGHCPMLRLHLLRR
jgi:hypothetical protein